MLWMVMSAEMYLNLNEMTLSYDTVLKPVHTEDNNHNDYFNIDL